MPKRTSSLKVEKLDEPLTVEVEKITLSVSEEDKKDFLHDPERFLVELLEASGHTVNRLHIVSSEMEALKKEVQASGAATRSTWHCIDPPRMKCRRIVVTETNK